jgi:hypothetical protein
VGLDKSGAYQQGALTRLDHLNHGAVPYKYYFIKSNVRNIYRNYKRKPDNLPRVLPAMFESMIDKNINKMLTLPSVHMPFHFVQLVY